MFISLILESLVFLFFCLVIVENEFKPKIPSIATIREKLNKIKLIQFFPLFLYSALIIFVLLAKGIYHPVLIYLYLLFSLSLLAQGIWVSWNLDKKIKILFVILAILISITRILWPSTMTHDLFVFFILLGIGPVLTSFKFFTKKVFVGISVIWCLYDIFYIWISPMYPQVLTMTEKVSFPLAVIVGNQSIGLADLFWGSVFISMLKSRRQRVVGAVVLIASSLFLIFT